MLGWLLFAVAARQALAQQADSQPIGIQTAFRDGVALVEAERYEEAVQTLVQVCDVFPAYYEAETGSAAYWLGQALKQMHEPERAHAVWALGLDRFAKTGFFDFRLADQYVRSVFHANDALNYERASHVYLEILARLNWNLPEEERAIVRRYAAQVEFLLPEDIRKQVVQDGYQRGQGAVRYRPRAGAVLQRWWRGQDPVPATPQNERLVAHLSRVAYAETAFGYSLAIRGFDDRGEVYVRLGPPLAQASLDMIEASTARAFLEFGNDLIRLPENVFWSYQHIDEATYYLFVFREGRYQISTVQHLLPSTLRRGVIAESPEGRARATGLINILGDLYRQLSTMHVDYEKRSMEVDNFRDGIVKGPKVTAFAQQMLVQTRFEDDLTTRKRIDRTPRDYAPVVNEAQRLSVDVRFARFLDEDGSTHTEIYWGHRPGTLQFSRKQVQQLALGDAGSAYGSMVDFTAVQRSQEYEERGRSQRRYRVPGDATDAPMAVHALRLPRTTDTLHLALQWDQYLFDDSDDEDFGAAHYVRTGVYRADTVAVLNNAPGRLEMSDLVPVFFAEDAAVLYQDEKEVALSMTPYPFTRIIPEVELGFYFEIYHLTYGADDQTHFSVEYEVIRAQKRLLGSRQERTSAQVRYTGNSRTAREFIALDLSDVEGKGSLEVVVRVTDDTAQQQVERTISFMRDR